MSFLFAVLTLGACAQPSQPPSVPPALPAAAQAAQATRVIIEFKQAVPYRSDAWVAELARTAQARVRYIASVSDDTHVYEITPPANVTLASALSRLNALASIRRTEVDQLLAPLPPLRK